MRAVTKVAIREARLKEIKHELLNSQKLQSYFEDNPRDLQLLRHDKSLHTVTRQAHLQNVPDYLGKLQFFWVQMYHIIFSPSQLSPIPVFSSGNTATCETRGQVT